MAARKLPATVARITGAATKNPARYRGKAPKVGPLGDPPERLTEAERGHWLALAADLPWLGSSDRMLLELAATISARLSGGGFTVGLMTELRLCLGAMGATPTTRGKLAAPTEGDDDPAAAYFT